MRAVIQRVTSASVTAGEYHATVGRGFLVLLGVAPSDELAEAHGLADKVVALRVFEDAAGKMNLALGDVGGEVLCISQFTLYGDVRRGNRPSFVAAAAPEIALRLYEAFCGAIEAAGVSCQRGVFGAHMEVSLVNDGPVTIIIDSDDLARPRRT